MLTFVAVNLTGMNYTGILIGAATFLCIGICHPIVIKLEYAMGKKGWWCFLISGIVFSILSLFVHNMVASSILGAFAFSCFWGIYEMFQQENRVLKGWFPENPARHGYYEKLRWEKGIVLPKE